MSAQSDLIDFFQLNATFDPTTRVTRDIIQSSDRAQLKRQIVTVKEWKRQAEPISYGASGIVWLEHDEDGKESRAVKQIQKATPMIPLETDYKRELHALGRLSKRQDLFVHFHGWFENDRSIFLAMEYFELGDLEKFITPKLTEKDVKVIGRQLLEGLQVLHGYHLAHRDLKPANIFVARCAPDWWIKLGDFGIARRIFTEHNSKLTRIGTSDYMAPEILFESNDDEQNPPHTLAIDMWSLGCVLFRLLTQGFPFPQGRDLRLYLRSRKPFPSDILIKHNVSEDGVSLISKMMKSNPADRMTVTMALLHSWVTIKESTPTPGYFDFFKENVEDELDDESAKKGPATQNPITSHIGSGDIPPEINELLPSNSSLTSLQTEEMVQLRKPTPDAKEHIFDSSDKDTDTLESRSNLANSYTKPSLNEEVMHQILKARKLLLSDGHYNSQRVLNNLGKSLNMLGDDQEGVQLCQQILEVLKRRLGDEDPDTLLGWDQEVRQLCKQTFELQKRLSGDDHPDILWSMYSLALSYSLLGQHQKAMHLYKQMLELRKRILGDEHPKTLESMHNLAFGYFNLGQYHEAMHLDKQTLELRKRILGDSHLDTLQSMHNIAGSYSNLGQDHEAMGLYKQTLELQKRILGDEHPDTLWSMRNLARSYFKLGQHQEAVHLHKQTLELRKRILGDEHPDTLDSMHNLAFCYCKPGQHQEAMGLYKQTLELRKRILGDDHPDTLLSMNGLAFCYSALGQHQEAVHLHKQTLDLRKRILGDEHPDTLWSMNGLARSYSKLGQDQEAMHLYKQTLELQKRILGDEHPDTLLSMNGLALSYSSLGQHKEAIHLGKQVVEARERISGPAHPATISSAQNLARISRASQKETARTKSPRRLSRYLQFLKR